MSALIEERCVCGSTLRFEPRSSIYADGEARRAAREWREGHKHEVRKAPEQPRKRIPLAGRRAS